MADKPTEKVEAAEPAPDVQKASTAESKVDPAGPAGKDEANADKEAPKAEATAAEGEPEAHEKTDKVDESAPEKADQEEEKKEKAAEGDVEMKDAADTGAAEEPAAAASETPAAKGKARRKSTAAETKGKTLNKKNSKARLTHIDAKPGDHFLVKLKGFPAWPAVICDESMLPVALINSRPVTAAKPDGTYAEAYADGGKRVNDRTFPVMYLHTNEFGWVSNNVLSELSPEKAKESITDKMRKDLRAAFDLAAEHHSIDHYKEILKKFQEDLAASAAAAATPKKSKKGKGKAGDDEDVDMDDADDGSKSKSKKRKAEEDAATPQRPDSVKKPKIKLNTSSTPKTANGTSTPKSKEESASAAKSKTKKAKEAGDKKAEASKESKMTSEERRARKEKEVLYLRHKLQRGLLTRDQQPQESEMKQMSDFIFMLEGFADLEVSIIRGTKINKVLKTILKLDTIPREDEFHFKDRSQALLDKWNKLMAGESAQGSGNVNGVNGTAEGHTEKTAEPNGVKDEAEEPKVEAEKTEGDDEEMKDEPAKPTKDQEAAEEDKEPAKEKSAPVSEAVEATA